MEDIAKRVMVEYGDGSQKEIRKGMCLEFYGEGDGGQCMTADMVGMAGMDIVMATAALFELVDRMGLTDVMLAYIRGCGCLTKEGDREE